jgi:uncharacterized protein YerC
MLTIVVKKQMPEYQIDLKSKKLLYNTIKDLKPDEFIDLIESLLSASELKDISRRIMVAKLLKEGFTYTDIIEKMGMSESTVGKIHSKTHGSPIIIKLFNKD